MPEPRLLVLNAELATELGVDPEALRADHGVAVLAMNTDNMAISGETIDYGP